MLTTAKAVMHLSVLTLGTIALNFATLPINAQSNPSESFNFEQIDAEKDSNFYFISEDETTSIKDNLQELREYDISDTEDGDVRLIEENQQWGNVGDKPDYKIRTGIYSY